MLVECGKGQNKTKPMRTCEGQRVKTGQDRTTKDNQIQKEQDRRKPK